MQQDAKGSPGSELGPATSPVDVGRVARRGVRATLTTQLIVQFGSIIATMFLARLLTPVEFGIIAATQSVMGAALLLNLAGMNAALIARKDRIQEAAATYFWTALVLGLALFGVFWVAADPITALLGQPESTVYLRWLAACFPLSLLAIVPQALLQRELRFRAYNTALLIPALAYFLCEVVLAVSGFGVWAVILGQILEAGMKLVIGLIQARWWPRHRFRLAVLKEDFGLLAGLSISRVLNYVHKNVDYWLTSAQVGPAALGVYYVAYVLPNIVRLRLSGIFRAVMLPIMVSQVTADDMIRAWRRSATAMLMIGLPMLAGVAAVAEPLTLSLFGSQWHAAVLPMQILVIGTFADLITQAVGTAAIVGKRVGRDTTVLALRVLITTGAVALAAFWLQTLVAIAAAVSLAGILTLVIQDIAVARPLGVGFRSLGRECWTSASISVAMFGVVTGVLTGLGHFGLTNPIALLAIGVSAGVASYLGFGIVFDRPMIRQVLSQMMAVTRGR